MMTKWDQAKRVMDMRMEVTQVRVLQIENGYVVYMMGPTYWKEWFEPDWRSVIARLQRTFLVQKEE